MVSPPSGSVASQRPAAAAPSERPAQERQRSTVSGRTASHESPLLGGILVVALVLRLPYLWDVPRFTDELQEILWSLAIYRGEIKPLTAVDS